MTGPWSCRDACALPTCHLTARDSGESVEVMRTPDRLSTDTATRWRVALLGPHDGSFTDIKVAVTQAGGDVVMEAPPRLDSLTLIADAAPNVLILQPRRANGQPPDLLPFTSAGHPVVLFTRDTSRTMLKLAARSGVAAFLVQPLQPAQLAPTLDLAIARFGDWERLRRKLADRKVIERAKGRVMTLARLTEDEAFRWLRNRAMDTRSSLADVAKNVLDATALASDSGPAVDPPRAVRASPQSSPRERLRRAFAPSASRPRSRSSARGIQSVSPLLGS